MKICKRIFLKFAHKKGQGGPASGQEGRSLEVRLEVDGFPSSLLSVAYQCWRPRHDFLPLKSEDRHKHLLGPESKVDGVAPSLPLCYQASTIRILPAGGGTRPAFSNPSTHSKGGREALTLEAKARCYSHMAHSDRWCPSMSAISVSNSPSCRLISRVNSGH